MDWVLNIYKNEEHFHRIMQDEDVTNLPKNYVRRRFGMLLQMRTYSTNAVPIILPGSRSTNSNQIPGMDNKVSMSNNIVADISRKGHSENHIRILI